jgi:phage major head subunit gpT-like protein
MIVNAATINAITRSVRTLSYAGIESAATNWMQVAMRVGSESGSNDYGWLESVPGMREWVGDRELANLQAATYSVKNKEYEATVSIKRKDIEDDQVGIYSPMFTMLGQNVAYHRDEIVFDLLKNGFSQLCYDGKTFFATTHKIGKTTVSNKGTGKLTRARFQDALADMQSIKNSVGKPLRNFMGTGANAPLLVVGPSNRALADEIVGLPTVSGGGANVDYQKARVLVLAEFSDAEADFWMLLDTSKAVKPLILQVRKEPEFVRMDGGNDEAAFMRAEYRYGFDDRKNAGFGFWQLAYGSDGSVA